MKRFLLPVLLMLLFAPAFGQSPPAAPTLPSFFLLSGTASRDSLTRRTVGYVQVGMGKDITPNQRILALTTFWSTPGTSGGAGGAGYEFIPWDSGAGTRLVLHGDGQATVGGINEQAALIGVAGIGAEFERKSIRGAIFVNSTYPVNTGPDAGQLRQVALNLRLAFLTR